MPDDDLPDAAGLAALRAELERRLAELERLEAATRDDRRPVELDQQSSGRLTRMDALQQQQMALATGQRRQAAGQRIRAALARMDAGDYGWCLSCDEAIEPARLRLDPATPLCLACQQGGEQR
ncbi:transcriptional regulator, TraR/DksA family [Tistlia consotensis]|uniref:Transcriptional regulator, TraR/DksA family n=1 Tax=Tistlia consotensis USBA 355 TaxID=560819 RepID=A0A1Y6C2Q6_9PROT|nr:TraR/DksA family transcriptional regulator [Tistlia consotensis]SMF40665.1 transcriptional regulator, TraR/DksA family [Tistlia consotensis USBA 355]SNR74622.1 transcriptional regulator, TraR/DksA family [Tistlia consotensis]